jgi:hypothetical protein
MAQLVDAVHYEPEGKGFDSWWDHSIFHYIDTSGHNIALGSTQPPTEMSITDIFWRVKPAGELAWRICPLRVPTA